jgi:hypothetical protein
MKSSGKVFFRGLGGGGQCNTSWTGLDILVMKAEALDAAGATNAGSYKISAASSRATGGDTIIASTPAGREA